MQQDDTMQQDDDEAKPSPRPDTWLYIFMLVMLLTGCCNVLLKDFFVIAEAPVGPSGRLEDFNRPFLWSFLMKVGMALCLPFYLEWPKAPIHIFVLSCSLGLFTDILVNISYFALAGSAVIMLRGGKVVFTAILSVAWLGRQQRRFEVVGAFLVAFGIALVGLSAWLQPAPSRDVEGEASGPRTEHVLIAIGFALAGELCQAVLWVYQEKVLKQYSIPPLQLVGLEGFIGIFLGAVLLAAVQGLGLENIPEAAYQLRHSMPLAIAVIVFMVSVAFYNHSGIGVTERNSAVARSVVDVSRSVLIWAVEIALGWHRFSFSQLLGFSVIVVGALLYNHLLVLPMLEESEETKVLIANESGESTGKQYS
jgi:hypothetical protein